jgi:hypothetical protein
MASDVSEAKTIAISDKISMFNINESVVCGYRLKKSIIIARRCVNSYSITEAPANCVTYVSLWWCVYQADCNGSKFATRLVAWATGGVKFSARGYEVVSEPSEPPGTPGRFRTKLKLLLMFVPNWGGSLQLWSLETRMRKKNHNRHLLPFFHICSNSYTRILDRSSPLFGS